MRATSAKESKMAVRCLVERDGKVLLCHFKKHNFYFLPGGSVEFQETLHEAIYREFQEEMGIKREDIAIQGFICLMEVMYDDLHGTDPIFRVDITPSLEVSSIETHIDFTWVARADVDALDVRPSVLKEWLKNSSDENHLVYKAV